MSGRSVARAELHRWFTEVYHNPAGTDASGIHGTPEQVRERLEEVDRDGRQPSAAQPGVAVCGAGGGGGRGGRVLILGAPSVQSW